MLQLPRFRFHGERRVGDVAHVYDQGAIVVLAFELGDEPAVFNLPLADAYLELIRPAAGVAQVDVTDVGEYMIVTPALVRASEVVTRVERQTEPGNLFAQPDGRIGVFGQCTGPRVNGKQNAVAAGEIRQARQALHLGGSVAAGTSGGDRNHRHHRQPGQAPNRLELAPEVH